MLQKLISKGVVKVNRLQKYFIPPRNPEEFKICRLRTLTYVGYMEMGKSTTEKTLMARVSRTLYELYKVEPLNIIGKNLIDIVKWIDDNKDLVKGTHYINMFVDDVLFSGTSTERTKGKRVAEKLYANIRHELEKRGFHGVLRLCFAGQRWRLIPPFFRNSPYIIFKDVITQDFEERWWISRMVGQDLYEFLKYVSERALDGWDDEIKRYSVVRHFVRGSQILDIEEPEEPKELYEIPLGYADTVSEVESYMYSGNKMYPKKKVIELMIGVAKKANPGLGIKSIMGLMRELGLSFDNTKAFEAYKRITGSLREELRFEKHGSTPMY